MAIQQVSQRWWIMLMAALLGVVIYFAVNPNISPAEAATGDVVGSVTFDTNCTSGIGVGIGFDGSNLWYSCYASATDLYRAGTDGVVTASYSIDGGLGALAYDAGRNGIWAGWGGGAGGAGVVWFIQLDAGKNVTGFALVGNVSAEAGMIVCNLDDGLGYDGLTDELYFSDDCSTTIHNYDVVPGSPPTVGAELEHFAWGGVGCYNSGLAIGGQLLYEGSDGCNHVWVVDKDTRFASFDFVTTIGEIRDEDLECDEITFAGVGKEVMWSIEAYDVNVGFVANNRLAGAYEIPSGSCLHGGGAEPMKGRMTGGGSVLGSRVTHGFELHCDMSLPNNLQINWDKKDFHLTSLDAATCSDEAGYDEGQPEAGFDTFTGKGTGRYRESPGGDWLPGYKVKFRFTDAGEPGKDTDHATIDITDAIGGPVLSVAGLLHSGNHQAHPE
ncbi:MAG: hypothetical protein AAB567_01180 [Patescibacteria group bacterium]